MPQSRTRSALQIFGVLLPVFLLFFLAVPWQPAQPSSGLDASFRYALHELHVDEAQFGSEIIHQYGPWGFLVNDLYHPGTRTTVLVLRAYLALTMGALVVFLARRFFPPIPAFLWAIALAGPLAFFDVPYLVLPQLALAVFLSDDHHRFRRLLLIATAPALALTGLMKFNYLLMLVTTLAAAPFVELLRTRLAADSGDRPRLRSAFLWAGANLLTVPALWLLAGQRVGDFLPFLSGGLHLSATYGVSHSFPGPLSHSAAFALFGGLFVLAMTASELGQNGTRRLALPLALALFLFLAFKHAFVRHDPPHGAFGALYGLTAVLLYGLPALAAELRNRTKGIFPRTRLAAVAGASLAFFALCTALLGQYRWPAPDPARFYIGQSKILERNLRALPRMLQETAPFEEPHERALARLREQNPIPPLDGTVDLYPYNSNLLLAHGLRYNPRPLLQSYQACDTRLAQLDARHLEGPDAPDHLLWGIAPIDRRLPALDDSLSWPLVLSHYRPRDQEGSLLVLDRTSEVAEIVLGAEHSQEITFNQWVDLGPRAETAQWMEASLHRTLAGRLAGLLFREPQIFLFVRFEDGVERSFRFLPGVGEAGFLLSPVVESPGDFARLYEPDPITTLAAQRVVAIRFLLAKTWSYQPDIALRLRSFERRPTPDEEGLRSLPPDVPETPTAPPENSLDPSSEPS